MRSRPCVRNGRGSIRPARIQELAQRHLQLKPLDARQIDNLANLPERPKPPLLPTKRDPIGALITLPEDARR